MSETQVEESKGTPSGIRSLEFQFYVLVVITEEGYHSSPIPPTLTPTPWNEWFCEQSGGLEALCSGVPPREGEGASPETLSVPHTVPPALGQSSIEFPGDLVKCVFSSSFYRWGIWSSKVFRNLLLITQQTWDMNQVCLWQIFLEVGGGAYIRLFLYMLYGTQWPWCSFSEW